jgi:hypothetical protein
MHVARLFGTGKRRQAWAGQAVVQSMQCRSVTWQERGVSFLRLG